MTNLRIHIVGASGSGTTYLGRALARELGCAYIDTDSIFWEPTFPPFQKFRPEEERTRLLLETVQTHPVCVISGNFAGWGDPVIPLLDLVVFLYVTTEERLKRLKQREALHFGEEALAPGGYLHQNYTEFMEWAAGYDMGGEEIRSLQKHEKWLTKLPCPVLRLEGVLSLESQLNEIRKLIRP
ncbi:MAG: hypothetical protein JSV52_08330 [Candidatus Zixiibacteriota bacterium]|nr:MAG: hypothetical protein JSV52_08330 [candidate division Zixibacteria bacterium]